MKPQITKIKATNPQALVVVGADPAAAMAIRQAKELGLTIPILGTPPLTTAAIMNVKELRDGLEGGIFSSMKPDIWEQLADNDPQKKPAAELDKLMRAKYSGKYNGLEWSAAQGYDAFMLLTNAMRQAKINPADLVKARSQARDALEQTKGYIGPLRHVHYHTARPRRVFSGRDGYDPDQEREAAASQIAARDSAISRLREHLEPAPMP